MKKLLPALIALLLAMLVTPQAVAQEKNGLSVNVTKRTLNRNDKRSYAYYTRYDRTQGFKVVIRNTSLKPLPEGEVSWTILVRKALYSNRTEKYVGTEKLKPLRPSESVELMVGAVPIEGYRYERDYKDDMEYELVMTHSGKETARFSSKPAFAALAKGAILMRNEPEEETPAPRPDGARPTTNPSPATPTTPIQPRTPGAAAPTMPANPVAQPAFPAATPPATAANTTPPATNTTPATPPEEAQPFDFFNLNKKKAEEGK